MQIMAEKIQKHFLERSNIFFYQNIFSNMKCQILTFFIYFLQRKPLTFRSKTIVQQSIEPSTRTTSTSAPSLWSRASPPGVSCMSSSDILFIFHIFISKKRYVVFFEILEKERQKPVPGVLQAVHDIFHKNSMPKKMNYKI